MLVTIVGNGSGDTLYDNKVIEVSDDVTYDEVQQWGDTWVRDLPDSKKDSFDDLDCTETTIEEIVSAMPDHWQARVPGDACYMLFL